MTLYMETTKIPAERTAQEITSLLAESGANQILIDYGTDRQITGLRWSIMVDGAVVSFTMPVRTEPVFNLLIKKIAPQNREKYSVSVKEQARRVAWRQLLRWVQAQLAFIGSGMVAPQEAFGSYIEVRRGVTLYQAIAENKFKALPAGKPQ